MPRHVEPKKVPFMPEFFDCRPRREMNCVAIRSWSCCHLQLTEKRDLAAAPVSVRGCSSRQSLIDAFKLFRTIFPCKVECPSPDQVFQNLAVDRFGIQTTAIILDRFERAILLSFNDGQLHSRLADVLDRGKAVANTPTLFLSLRDKLQMTPVDVRGQNRYSEPLAFGNKYRNFIRIIDFITE